MTFGSSCCFITNLYSHTYQSVKHATLLGFRPDPYTLGKIANATPSEFRYFLTLLLFYYYCGYTRLQKYLAVHLNVKYGYQTHCLPMRNNYSKTGFRALLKKRVNDI